MDISKSASSLWNNGMFWKMAMGIYNEYYQKQRGKSGWGG